MDPSREGKVRLIFDNANFIRDLGLELSRIEDGTCETTLVPQERHQQQHGFVHAAVLAAMADHTAGCAARSAVDFEDDVITVEFKINFLRPALADRLRCRSQVLRAGQSIVVCESEVFAAKDADEKLVSKGIFTLAVRSNGLSQSGGRGWSREGGHRQSTK
jgi:uncharacterized protein (TIGR00369 family)